MIHFYVIWELVACTPFHCKGKENLNIFQIYRNKNLHVTVSERAFARCTLFLKTENKVRSICYCIIVYVRKDVRENCIINDKRYPITNISKKKFTASQL